MFMYSTNERMPYNECKLCGASICKTDNGGYTMKKVRVSDNHIRCMCDPVVQNPDKRFIEAHQVGRNMAENMIKNGLKAHDIVKGVGISHEDYIRLFDLAVKGLKAS